MSDKNIAASVNTFMLANAPALTDTTSMGYDLLKQLTRALIYKVKTTREHAAYVMNKKYAHLYAASVITGIIDEGCADEVSERIECARISRAQKKSLAQNRPRPMFVC